MAEGRSGPEPGPFTFRHLAGCSRCGLLHGNGDEPPFGWAPLVNVDEDAVGAYSPALFWGVVCPDCRVIVGDQTVTLKVKRPVLRVAESPDAGEPAEPSPPSGTA